MTQLDTLNDLLHARFSCRAFRPDPVPQEHIEQIIEAARHAPSWCNAQPWQVILTSGDRDRRNKLLQTDSFKFLLRLQHKQNKQHQKSRDR